MQPLTAETILKVWDAGQSQHPLDRALSLLAACSPNTSWDALAGLSIGQRDQHLLTLRELTFGPHMSGFAACPDCGERIEFRLDTERLRVAQPEPGEGEGFVLRSHGYEVRFRLPDSHDLASVAALPDAGGAREALLRRCVLRATRAGQEVADGVLPEPVVAALVERLAACDPQADIVLDLTCPACDGHWAAMFDVLAFFWTEISRQARRLVREVHSLARAYGWREADILAMSARRRQAYLELAS